MEDIIFKDNKFTMFSYEGKETEYYILFEFEYRGKLVIVYTDYSIGEQEKTNIFVSTYNQDGLKTKLEPVHENSECFKLVKFMLMEILSQAEAGYDISPEKLMETAQEKWSYLL